MASNTVLKWMRDSQSFVSTDSTGHSVVLSTTHDGIGMKPSELILSALSACSSVDVVEILRKKKTPLSTLQVHVTAEQDEDPPWTYRKIHMHFLLGGSGLTEKNVAQAIQLSEERYCSVAATLRGVAEITTSFEILTA